MNAITADSPFAIVRKTPLFLTLLLAVAALSMSVGASTAAASDASESGAGQARLVPLPYKTPQVIDGLVFDRSAGGVRRDPNGRFLARISGRFSARDASLVVVVGKNPAKYSPVPLRGEEGRFDMEIPIGSAVTELEFLAISPYGEVKRQRTMIYFSDWDRLHPKPEQARPSTPPRSLLQVGLSVTTIDFSQTNIGDYDELALTVKASYLHALFYPDWEWNLSGFATALPIAQSYPASARFFGADFKVGYHLPWPSDSWRLKLWFGGYYETMSVTSELFGYQNVIGPEVAASLQRALNNGDALQGFAKFALLSNGSAFLSSGNNEVSLGLGYSHFLKNGHPLGVNLDGSLFRFLSNAVQINVDALSVGASYGF